ncbi:hypothetical protein [Ornithinibacillus halotolerans]|uniref:Uncharacterized protein n=1 Tax=Ornithinibacillus halotolerans TaxID=1274357 RepID=A0A916RTP9_9BACI|nr:hypothetical protein [Ornithinibacillus halotolerans]GGA65774.1 hypothetical protein GCM10008025_06980 [Ornithinibacillus halotolerans]
MYKGIDAYESLKQKQTKSKIPVFVTEQTTITELEWTFRLFQSCMQENVNHQLKYDYLSLLLKETKNNMEKICHHTGVSKEDIYPIIFDSSIPRKYKDLAIKHDRITIINQIATHPQLQPYRTVLYPALFQRKHPLTPQKLKLFLMYLDSGYELNVNSILALQNFNQIVNLDQALKCYWDHIQFPDTQIMEGAFYYKGDKNSKINVRL